MILLQLISFESPASATNEYNMFNCHSHGAHWGVRSGSKFIKYPLNPCARKCCQWGKPTQQILNVEANLQSGSSF